MADFRVKTLTVDPLSSSLTIQNGFVSITNTTSSVNGITGALIVNGGIAINCSYDSISSTSGGALTIRGGMSVNSKTYLGDNLTLDSNTSTLSIKGVSSPRLFVDTITNKNIYMSPNGSDK